MRQLTLLVPGLIALAISTTAVGQESLTDVDASLLDGSTAFVELGLRGLKWHDESDLSVRIGSWPIEERQWLEPCTVTKGKVLCRLPVGRHHLRLDVDGFSPLYLKNVETIARATRRLGTFQMLDGAAVAGRITPPQASVSLTPTKPPPAPEDNRLWIPHGGGMSQHESGFFHAGGLRPGKYVLSVESPGHESRRLEVSLVEGEEFVVEPINLARVP